jgi:hypothetical protein
MSRFLAVKTINRINQRTGERVVVDKVTDRRSNSSENFRARRITAARHRVNPLTLKELEAKRQAEETELYRQRILSRLHRIEYRS